MTAEHVKWGTHLVGCAQLISELDFARLTQDARRLRASNLRMDDNLFDGMPVYRNKSGRESLEESLRPDENIVSTIVGKKISYDDYGRVFETDGRKGREDGIDLPMFETLQDLYWFYARQDAFQSMISGNPLM